MHWLHKQYFPVCLTIGIHGAMIQKTNKKGVNFMLNMINFGKVYGRSLAPWVFVG